MPKKLTQEEFLAKAVAVHGERYDYSRVVYRGSNEKVQIICTKHGLFEQLPNSHTDKGAGCQKCKGETLSQLNSQGLFGFIQKSRAVHGNAYDYSQVIYTRSSDKVKIGCPAHGFFEQNAKSHTVGIGCPQCYRARAGKELADTLSSFTSKAHAKHGDRYDYSRVIYQGSKAKVEIGCPTHGTFQLRPAAHLVGQGCQKCKGEKASRRLSSNTNEFITKAQALHGDKYDYSQVVYMGNKTRVSICCPTHGRFEQMPNSHLIGQGCPKCGQLKRAASHLYDTELFIKLARAAHGDTYDYSQSVYAKTSKKLTIICPRHGPFEQRPQSHIKGRGCSACKDERHRLGWIAEAAGRPCTLYFLRVFDKAESFYKVGITFNSVERRFSHRKGLAGYQYEVLARHTSTNAAAVWDWEQSILSSFAYLSYAPSRYFFGRTECFHTAEPILEIFPL